MHPLPHATAVLSPSSAAHSCAAAVKTQAAVCAAGALANLFEEEGGALEALASCLGSALAGGAVFHSLEAGLQSPATTS